MRRCLHFVTLNRWLISPKSPRLAHLREISSNDSALPLENRKSFIGSVVQLQNDPDNQDAANDVLQNIQHVFPNNVRFLVAAITDSAGIRAGPDIALELFRHGHIHCDNSAPFIQMLSRLWVVKEFGEDLVAVCNELYSIVPERLSSLKIFLDLFTNKWPVKLTEQNYIFKTDLFCCLVVAALRHADLNQLQNIMQMIPDRLLHSDPVVLQLFANAIRQGNRELVSLYFKNISGQVILDTDFQNIQNVLNSAGNTSLKAVRVAKGKCNSCGIELKKEELRNEDFNQLRETYAEYLKSVCKENRRGFMKEFNAMGNLMSNVIHKRGPSSRGIVVDLLNVQNGRPLNARFGDVFTFLDDLKQHFNFLFLIMRQNMRSHEIIRQRNDNIEFFFCDKNTYDDLFAIYAALSMGPNTYLLTNDRFIDIQRELAQNDYKEIKNLFNLWLCNRTIGFTANLETVSLVESKNCRMTMCCNAVRVLYLHRLRLSITGASLFHLSPSWQRTRKTVVTPIRLRIKSSKEIAEIYPNMTLSELCISLQDNERNVLTLERKALLDVVALYGMKPRLVSRPSEEKLLKQLERDQEDVYPQPLPPASELEPRAPVVTIMGHVDHGKTTLLDALRKSRITASEFGGITQHIGAFSVILPKSKAKVTFLDTPGHAAFKAMRARGAKGADIVVLVVAADDGTMDQTVESIRYANEAGVPIVVAINKCDRPNADPARAKRSLMEHGVIVEEMGGDVMCVEISALQGTNLDELQEALVAQAEIMELKSTKKGAVEGIVIESTTAQGLGPVCTLVVNRGTLKKGAFLISGCAWGRVRTLLDEFGKSITEAGPSTPVRIAGWRNALPNPGDIALEVPEGEERARKIAGLREERLNSVEFEKDLERVNAERDAHREAYNRNRKALLDRGIQYGSTNRLIVHRQNRLKKDTGEDEKPTVRLIIRTDVDGTLEAIQSVLATYNFPDVELMIVDAAVGPPFEELIEIAAEFKALIYCFNVPIPARVRTTARQHNVTIEEFNVIYRLVESLRALLNSVYPPIVEMRLVGEGHVLKEFRIPDRDRKRQPIAGTLVDSGLMMRNCTFKFLRGGVVYYEGPVESLKRETEFVSEVSTNTEVGIALADKSIRFKTDDTVEVYEEVTVQRFIEWNPPGF